MSSNSSWILSLWCATWLRSSARQSWTIWAIISPSSSMIVYYGGVLYAFSFLHMPPVCVASLLFPPSSCGLGFEVVSYAPSACFCCSLVECVLSFFPFWVLVFFVPSSACDGFPWPVLGFLGTWISGGYVSPFSTFSFIVLSDTSWVMDRIFHSSGHSLMTMSMSPSVM
jgi:hypothetical protein